MYVQYMYVCKPYKNHLKMEKDVGIKIVNVKKHWNKVGLFATQGWTGIGIDVHRARHAMD